MYGRLCGRGETILDGWVMDEINMVDLKEGEIVEEKLDNDEFDVDKLKLGFEGDPTYLGREMEREGIPPNRGGRT
jgi:hypothetical protein